MQLSQPIYFETEVLKLSRATARRADGVVVFEQDEISLRSASRPIKLSLTHDGHLGRLGMKVQKNAGLPVQYGFAWEMKF